MMTDWISLKNWNFHGINVIPFDSVESLSTINMDVLNKNEVYDYELDVKEIL